MAGLTVVVIWTGYRAGPWALRALRAAGHRVVALHPVDQGRGRSTACLRPGSCPSPSEDPQAFVDAVSHACRRAGADALMPLDEDAVGLLAGRRDDLPGVVLVGPDAAQYAALCDKAALAASARSVGLEAPAAARVGPEGRDGDWPGLPCVVKPRRSSMEGADVPAVVRADDPGNRDEAVRRVIAAGGEAVVEEFLTGTHWTIHVVRGGDGTVAAYASRVMRTWPRGAGMPSVMEGVGDVPELTAAAGRLLAAVGFRGPANVQLFARDGRLHVHDVNLRLPSSVAIALRGGLDLPALGLAAALGRPWAPPRALRPVRYVSLVDELRALWAGPREGRRAALATLRAAAGADGLDPPPRDPLWILDQAEEGGRRTVRRARGAVRARR